MTATHVIASLLGIVALLLWGIKLVSAGVMGAFGQSLRHLLGSRLQNRFAALLAGTGVTLALQSSTATAMMLTSFAATGLVPLVPALAVMLGANIGTALIVQALSFDVTLLFPVLIFIGYLMQRSRRGRRVADIGTIVLGLGVILLSLDLLSALVAPLEGNEAVRQVLELIVRDPVLSLILAAILTFIAHSSVGSILFIMSLAGSGILTPESTIAMVVGANIGSAINPLIQASGGPRERLRVPVGNLVNRILGGLAAMALLGPLVELARWSGLPTQRLAPDFHLAFNIAAALASLAVLRPAARLLTAIFPEEFSDSDEGRARYLAPESLTTPKVALMNAAREVMHMADVAEGMLVGSSQVFRNNDAAALKRTRDTDEFIDRLYGAVRRYLAQVSQRDLAEEEKRRLYEILDFAVNIEHIGDIVDANLMTIAAQRIEDRRVLSDQAVERIEEMHERLIAHLRLAVSVFLDGNPESARELVEEKERFREMERAASEEQFQQILSGRLSGSEVVSRYIDVVRDLKRIDGHIAATVHPLLQRTGQLKPSRLA